MLNNLCCPNPALNEFWDAPARNRVLYGGRASSKSWDAAAQAIFLAQFCKIRVLCVRQFQNKIEESVYSLLKIQIERYGLQDKFKVLDNKIICKSTGSEFMFYGLWRHIGEIKSIESIDVLWSEESHLLSKEQWEILEPTIRKDGSECWFIFNPRLATDFVWQRFVMNPPPDTIVRRINYDENPFLSSTMLKIINAAKAEDIESYNHTYLGQPLTDDVESIIKRSHVIAAIDAHIRLDVDIAGSRRMGFDVADDGEDLCSTVNIFGNLINGCSTWKGREDEILKSCSRVWSEAKQTDSEIIYDAIGVGASCGAKFNELGKDVKHQKFFAGGAVINPDSYYSIATKIKNKDFYSNIKAQAWWHVAERLKNTYNAINNGQSFDVNEMLFIDSNTPELEALITELCTPRKSFDSAGRVMVESKKDLAKRGIKSPNRADAFIMAAISKTLLKPRW